MTNPSKCHADSVYRKIIPSTVVPPPYLTAPIAKEKQSPKGEVVFEQRANCIDLIDLEALSLKVT